MSQSADLAWLLEHLVEQVAHLSALTDDARRHPGDADKLARAGDEIFAIRETLDTLGVPLALASNADWRSAQPPSRAT